MSELYIKFIELLKQKAEKRNLSYGQLAYMFGAGRTTIRYWFSFKRRMSGEFILKAIYIFNLSAEEIKELNNE